jgi:outer membrane lipoprotein LolB
MFDWLAGRPWPGVPATRAPDGASFDQMGWHVDTSQLASAHLIAAERAQPAPPLRVRVKLDAPDGAAPPSAPDNGSSTP